MEVWRQFDMPSHSRRLLHSQPYQFENAVQKNITFLSGYVSARVAVGPLIISALHNLVYHHSQPNHATKVS